MYEDFFAKRVAELRTQKSVSARDMSLSLGQNRNYINQIENQKALPSMQGFFFICEYLGVTPQEFFDEGARNPEKLRGLTENLKRLDETALNNVDGIVRDILGKK
ncbi:helix-turn-helix domain-containing protein [Ruminococcaceae bacterium OttesenSCG-928-D13]|nr:helix-turn-helix domain-containing protein [Ruminococcaceae bacterium OttesenSCG-928-D13]